MILLQTFKPKATLSVMKNGIRRGIEKLPFQVRVFSNFMLPLQYKVFIMILI